jgi:hypothetical protein
VLLHGTFAGSDIAGLSRELSRVYPNLANRLSEIGKRWFDDLAGEVGNYTQGYADQLSALLNPESDQSNAFKIDVTRLAWTGENHHLGRADAVMQLVQTLAVHSPSERVLVLAHSHGGNVMVMLSLLMGADESTQNGFYEAARLHYRMPLLGRIDLPVWIEARELMVSGDFPKIDVATFGTPLRYRWDTSFCEKLLHFVHHRCDNESACPAQAKLPGNLQDALNATGGDYVQQLGVGGTDFLPSILAWRDWIVERKMQRMFESTSRRRDLWQRWKQGHRVADEGTTLLVDYPELESVPSSELFGHGVYTRSEWMPFQLNEIVERFYGD